VGCPGKSQQIFGGTAVNTYHRNPYAGF
jgi:hypothetical protein